jgi:SOS response regulatory protein OraA/RecX
MQQKLRSREHTPEDIKAVIDKLVDMNYLREEEYKRQRVKGMLFKGYANKYIVQKCSQEKLSVNDSFINQLREENHISANDEINRLIEKKLRYKEIPEEFEAKQKLKNKVLNFLISKGYSFDQIKSKVESKFYDQY